MNSLLVKMSLDLIKKLKFRGFLKRIRIMKYKILMLTGLTLTTPKVNY
jgi:hypothetical protein